jgi:hypothetical protein
MYSVIRTQALYVKFHAIVDSYLASRAQICSATNNWFQSPARGDCVTYYPTSYPLDHEYGEALT